MTTSSEGPPRAERSKAWSYLVTNLLVLPGLGSIMARHVIAGSIQIVLALGGFVLTLAALVKIVISYAQQMSFPNNPALYKAAILGIAIFLVAWFWSLATSLTLFRKK